MFWKPSPYRQLHREIDRLLWQGRRRHMAVRLVAAGAVIRATTMPWWRRVWRWFQP